MFVGVFKKSSKHTSNTWGELLWSTFLLQFIEKRASFLLSKDVFYDLISKSPDHDFRAYTIILELHASMRDVTPSKFTSDALDQENLSASLLTLANFLMHNFMVVTTSICIRFLSTKTSFLKSKDKKPGCIGDEELGFLLKGASVPHPFHEYSLW